MTMNVVTHLNFRGQAREALAFYRAVFTGHSRIVSYRDAGVPLPDHELDNVMWGQVRSGNGCRLMAYDVPSDRAWHPGTNAFFVSATAESADEVRKIWEGLESGGTIIAPLAPAAWSPLYGMVEDRFGVTWIVTQGDDE